MGSLKTQQLLVKLALLSQKQREKFSRQEILEKIAQVKLLAAKKRVPRLTLRKELIYLENKMRGVFEFEKKLHLQEKQDKTKTSSLKRQVTMLKNKLEKCGDKELHQKVEKLDYLLGEVLAKHYTEEDVELSKKIMRELEIKKKKVKRVKVAKRKSVEKNLLTDEMIERINELQRRVEALKHQVDINQELEKKDPEQLRLIEEKINLLETKLNAYYEKFPSLLSVKKEADPTLGVKHTLLFNEKTGTSEKELLFGHSPQAEIKSEMQLEKELPLPPPPKITR